MGHMFKLEIKTTNDAFAEDAEGEIARILDEVGRALRDYRYAGTLLDANGNPVGSYDYTAEAREEDQGGYDHEARPDDDNEPGDRCKDCGEDITWHGTNPEWMHVGDTRNA